MAIKRIKQFYIGLKSIFKPIKEEEVEFCKSHLSTVEYNIFDSSYKYDKKHSIRVAKSVQKLSMERNLNNKEVNLLVKSALLHDVGKINSRITIIDRIALVLLNKILGEKIKESNFKKVIVYYNHPEMSYNMLKNKINDEKLLYIIKNHHNNINSCDRYKEELSILIKCDEDN
ncbi:MAG: HD domain-containing protein [Terrisporobacter sp.]